MSKLICIQCQPLLKEYCDIYTTRTYIKNIGKAKVPTQGAAAYQLGNTSSRTITEVK